MIILIKYDIVHYYNQLVFIRSSGTIFLTINTSLKLIWNLTFILLCLLYYLITEITVLTIYTVTVRRYFMMHCTFNRLNVFFFWLHIIIFYVLTIDSHKVKAPLKFCFSVSGVFFKKGIGGILFVTQRFSIKPTV